jgi:hypothetical protein
MFLVVHSDGSSLFLLVITAGAANVAVLDIRDAGAIARQPSLTVVAEQVFDKRQVGLVDHYRIFTCLL